MLVPFVIDADSLDPDPAWSPATLRSCHNDIRALWDRFGLLLHDAGGVEQSRLKQAVLNLPQKQRSLWLEMLEHLPVVRCSVDWNGSVCAQTAAELCSDVALALVDDARAEVEFGMSTDEDEATVDSGPSGRKVVVCRLQSGRHSSVVRDAEALSGAFIKPGTPYREIWDQRFRALAIAQTPHLKHVSIVDRYAMEQHFHCPQAHLSGLNRFLRELDQDAMAPRYVSIYSAWTQKLGKENASDVEAEMRELVGRLPSGALKRLTVYMVPNSAFGEVSHDRFVRFGRYVWELGLGLRVLEGPVARERSSASFKVTDGIHQKVESELSAHARPISV